MKIQPDHKRKTCRILQNAYLDSSMTVDEFLDYMIISWWMRCIPLQQIPHLQDPHLISLPFIEYAAETDHTVIVMTGTPEPVEFYFKGRNGIS